MFAPSRRAAGYPSCAVIDGTPAHGCTLMAELATIVPNACRTRNAGAHAPTVEVITTAGPMYQHAFALVQGRGQKTKLAIQIKGLNQSGNSSAGQRCFRL